MESISALSDEELLSAGVPSDLLRDPSYVKAASLLPDIDQFDAAFFEYSPEEARLMDPQQRLLLEVAWEAFEDAGQPLGNPAKPVGVFTGLGGVVSSYLVDRLPFSTDLPGYTGNLTHLGNDKDFPSTRISYKLNLTGPSINVQTACSTSLVAVHLACQAILAGECDMALAGAASVRVPQRVGYTSVKGGILSPDGHCRAFDAAAQGTIFGSGVGMVLLKELGAAIADGNQNLRGDQRVGDQQRWRRQGELHGLERGGPSACDGRGSAHGRRVARRRWVRGVPWNGHGGR